MPIESPREWSRQWSWSAGRRNLASVVALLAMVGFVATSARPSIALELGDRRLVAWVQDECSQLDSRGYWKS